MLLAEAGCVFMCFILYMSGVNGQSNRVCALKGSSVILPCSAEHPTSTMKWFIVHWDGSTQIWRKHYLNESHVWYNMSAESNFTVTIRDLRENDAKSYCCSETTDTAQNCKNNLIQLQVTDLQVKVLPSSEGHTVTLMCSTSCPLSENPVVYMWYKNRAFLYEDWSPWYQQLVSSEEAATYSCAVRGYEHLRAPDVSVDSVTASCFTVTYAKGKMCSDKQKSEDKPCTITYPREVQTKTSGPQTDHIRLTCDSSCPPTAIVWYKNRKSDKQHDKVQFSVPKTSPDSFSCAVQGHEDLHSAEECLKVTMSPSSVVSEGQRVTVSCSTSCPLPDNTDYSWYLNGRPLTLTESPNKHLLLDPVSSHHAGNYSCAVETHKQLNISSYERTLIVQSPTGKWILLAAPRICAAPLVLILLAVLWCVRRKRTSGRSLGTETSDKSQQINLGAVYDEISAQPTEEDTPTYSCVHFPPNHTDPLYDTVQPHQPQEQEHVTYAEVSLRADMSPDYTSSCPN